MHNLLFVALIAATVAALDPLDYVNLFIGTVNGGHTFPGATVPHGMVHVGMDTDSPGNHAGYDGDAIYNVTGFSQLHQSGTGGQVPLSNFKLFPIYNCSAFEQCLTTITSRKLLRNVLSDGSPDDAASPGYFSTNLSNSIRVELTATRRTALHRYTFPPGSSSPRILLDVTNDGQVSANDITMLIEPDTGRMTASGSFANSFGIGRYKAYACVDFYGDFEGPSEYGPYKINYPDLWGTDIHQHYYTWGYEHGGLVGFPSTGEGRSTSILARVGISLLSVDQACATAEDDISDWDFERVVNDSKVQWRDILSRVQVNTTGVDENTTTLLYSSLYRTHISPGDFTDENPHWNSSEPYYDSYYCNWDTYRTLFPLMSLHDPMTYANIIRSMIDIQKNEGWLPECREMGTKQFIQGGSHGDPILAEFLVKYFDYAEDLGVSTDDLYTALVADAENTPPNWNIQGRQADAWKQYDTTFRGGSNTKQVSRAIEYAFDDFTISQVAKLLNKHDDVAKYMLRAGNFIHSWNSDVSVPDISQNITGFFQPKFANGLWNYTDPRHCSVNDPLKATCFLNAIRRDGFYETSPIVYSQYVPHDTAKLVELQGGAAKFIERLDWMFESNYFDSTNEPSQQIPHMYHYVNQPGYSARRVRETISTGFNTSGNGLPGNDDSGAMGSYVFFYLAGLYPLPGTREFLLSSPYFPSISFSNPLFNSTTSILSKNFGGENIFVKNVTVNGAPYKSACFLEWDLFESGATIELELTSDAEVGCGENGVPPSMSTGGYD